MKLAKVTVLVAVIGLMAASVQAAPVVTWMSTGAVVVGAETYNRIVLKGVMAFDFPADAVALNFSVPAGQKILQNQAFDEDEGTFVNVNFASVAALYNGVAAGSNPLINPYLAAVDTRFTYTGIQWTPVAPTETLTSYTSSWARLDHPVPSPSQFTAASTGLIQVLFTGNTLNLLFWPANGTTGESAQYNSQYVVPDPATLSLLVAGGAGLLLRRRRRA